MPVRWNITEGLIPLATFTISPTGTTPAESASFDDRTIPEGCRCAFVWRSIGDDAQNTGGTISVVKSVLTGGTFAAADVGRVAGGNPLLAANAGGVAAWIPEDDRPFTRLRFVGADADSDVTINGVILAIRGLL